MHSSKLRSSFKKRNRVILWMTVVLNQWGQATKQDPVKVLKWVLGQGVNEEKEIEAKSL